MGEILRAEVDLHSKESMWKKKRCNWVAGATWYLVAETAPVCCWLCACQSGKLSFLSLPQLNVKMLDWLIGGSSVDCKMRILPLRICFFGDSIWEENTEGNSIWLPDQDAKTLTSSKWQTAFYVKHLKPSNSYTHLGKAMNPCMRTSSICKRGPCI